MSGRNKLRVAGCMLLVEYKNYPPHGELVPPLAGG
jgi:hypothetical protein